MKKYTEEEALDAIKRIIENSGKPVTEAKELINTIFSENKIPSFFVWDKQYVFNSNTSIELIYEYEWVEHGIVVVGIIHRVNEYGKKFKTLAKWIKKTGVCIFCEDKQLFTYNNIDLIIKEKQ